MICHSYADQTPILTIHAGESSATVAIRGKAATDAAVEFARALARNAQVFAAEVERLHAEQTAPGASPDESAEQADEPANEAA